MSNVPRRAEMTDSKGIPKKQGLSTHFRVSSSHSVRSSSDSPKLQGSKTV